MIPGLRTRPMSQADWPDVKAIYAAGIATGDATFETEPPTRERFDTGHDNALRVVVVDAAGNTLGWAAAAHISERCAYTGVVEHSVYVHPDAWGRGCGRLLLGALIEQCEQHGIWTIQSGIFPENTASLALHDRCGFRVVGRRERIGNHHGRWRDVLLVERRSTTVGAT